jgi:hypothetical protein
MKTGFVYKWINKKTGMVYVGRHQGSVNDSYIGSSSDFIDAYNIDKKNWVREILFAGDYQQVKKQEIICIKDAVSQHGINLVFNKCFATKAIDNFDQMPQGKLYSLRKETEIQISQLQSEIDKLKKDKNQIDACLKKFSVKRTKVLKPVANAN